MHERGGSRAVRRWLAVLTGALLVSAVAGGPAASAGSGGSQTFEGSCDFSVTVQFDPPLTNSSRPTQVDARGDGRCTGTLTREGHHARQLNDEPVLYRAQSEGDQSCGSAIASGTGYLGFGRRKLHFELSELRVAAVPTVTLEGRDGGSFKASGVAGGDPVDPVSKCAGSGLERATVEVSGETDPTISG